MPDTPTTPAEQIRSLLDQLHDGITTRETVPTYRRVKRGKGREVALLEFKPHTTREPGLIAQLGVTSNRTTQAPVTVRRWVRDADDPCRRDYGDDRDNRECWHGRWITVRTEQRTVPGVVTGGAAVPGGSPGWDADGALSPMVGGGKPDAAEPIAEAWHTAAEIRAGLDELGRELYARGWRPPATLVTIALEDERMGEWIARRLRSLVDRARIAASYDAPIVVLRDVCCPRCGGPMYVREDASSAVWCGGTLLVAGAALPWVEWPLRVRCGASWPRGGWVRLLEEATAVEPAGEVPVVVARGVAAAGPERAQEVPAVLAGLLGGNAS